MAADPRHGIVHELLGNARDGGDWSFAPARITRAGGYCTGPRLEPILMSRRPAVLHQLPEPGIDAIWIRARIEALFGVTSPPENLRVEKTLMELGFVATRVQSGRDTAIPFLCSDYYGTSALYFAEIVSRSDVDAIGDAFWGLLVSSGKLADYRDRAYHIGAGDWMEYGCSDGKLFLEYVEDEDDDPPPPVDLDTEALASATRFLASIGDERPGTTCGEPGCDRGTVQASLFAAGIISKQSWVNRSRPSLRNGRIGSGPPDRRDARCSWQTRGKS